MPPNLGGGCHSNKCDMHDKANGNAKAFHQRDTRAVASPCNPIHVFVRPLTLHAKLECVKIAVMEIKQVTELIILWLEEDGLLQI